MSKQEKIICPAVRIGGSVLAGHSHISIIQSVAYGLVFDRSCIKNVELGFMGSKGNFFDKFKARDHAIYIGQLTEEHFKRNGMNYLYLQEEDLY